MPGFVPGFGCIENLSSFDLVLPLSGCQVQPKSFGGKNLSAILLSVGAPICPLHSIKVYTGSIPSVYWYNGLAIWRPTICRRKIASYFLILSLCCLGQGRATLFVKLRYCSQDCGISELCSWRPAGNLSYIQPQEEYTGHEQGSQVLHHFTSLSLRLSICKIKSLKRLSLRVFYLWHAFSHLF